MGAMITVRSLAIIAPNVEYVSPCWDPYPELAAGRGWSGYLFAGDVVLVIAHRGRSGRFEDALLIVGPGMSVGWVRAGVLEHVA